MKLLSVYYDEKDPFNFFKETICITDPNEIEEHKENSILILWGGQDISPSIYGEIAQPGCGPKTMSKRDIFEIACAKKAIELNIPIIGVCRGAQLMCCLNGGSLYQHVDHHNNGSHNITTYDDKVLITNSIHHQMMKLKKTRYRLLAWNSIVFNKNIPIEPEIVYFPDTKTLAIQGHPEYLTPENIFVKYCTSLIRKFLC